VCKVLKNVADQSPDIKENQYNISNVTFALVEMVDARIKGTLSEREWLSVLQLKSHSKEMRSKHPEIHQEAEGIAERALYSLGYPDGYSSQLMLELACAILTNSLTLVAPTCDPLGLVFDPFACLANHSCDPNAYVVMNGTELSFRTLKDIAAGEEVFVSYIDDTDAYQFRQKQLEKRYYFTCKCTKCQGGPKLEQDKFLKPAADVRRKAKEAVEHRKQHQGDTDMVVMKTLGRDNANVDYTELIDCFARNDLALALDWEHPSLRKAQADHPIPKIEWLRMLLQQCQSSGQYAATRQPYANARNEFILECIAQKDLEGAWLHSLKAYVDIDPVLYPQPHNPLRVVHSFRLAKLTMALAPDNEASGKELRAFCRDVGLDMPILAWKCMKEAAKNVDKSHGEDSSFAYVVKSTFKAAIQVAVGSSSNTVAEIEGRIPTLDGPIRSAISTLEY
jgi:SET and MYND domain-containing protein